ncbi:MAG TPA: S8 family peptidase [Anaerolineales bacterium]|nr:S8 family peptidase [Anaerolineales bacterium]
MFKTTCYKSLIYLLSLFLVISSFGPSAPVFNAGEMRIQPVLVQMAASDPDQTVNVIIQKTVGSTGIEEQVFQFGGKVTNDLSIINAFSAKMPAGAALEIARSSDVRWVSLDAPLLPTGCTKCIDTSKLANAYVRTIGADKLWNNSPYLQGQGIGVAVVDSGVNPNGDLFTSAGVNRQVADVRFNSDYNQNTSDGYGHGTHVASIIGGDGSESAGKYIGVAPMVNIINVKVSNDDGSALMADVVAGLQWVLANKNTYDIRVVNLSLNSSVAESYQTSPLDAAVEILWFNKIVVVASAGNQGSSAIYPPANDPFIITVGAADDKGTSGISDDVMASFSAYGQTSDGFKKPDLVAPGANVVARLVNQNMGVALTHPANKVGDSYFRMSGTSMAAPMVSASVALLLQDEPALTPDQVKYRLTATANKNWAGYNSARSGAGYLDVYAAVRGTTTQSANTGVMASQLLSTGSAPITWGSVGWNSVGWNSVGWNSVGWNSVGWNSVGWNSDYWAP